ncbi:Imm1 family immunity protein [Saccharopolyspora sp. ASAGF58]|nr:Imm1 family immunity protein [Saccharopolyspora sp. ASAGF58]QIZ37196.1 hypothetical protein FDZ84_24435 [Saccharopolyspora sp. ASAGF58]
MRPGAEVPIDIARNALRQFTTTGQRPTCVEWQPFDPFDYQS